MVAATNPTAPNPAAPTPTTPPKSDRARNTLGNNFETFLTLLTKQLQNQDPTAPMDTAEFTNQLVQYANVEQSINANSNLEKLISFQKTNQMSTAVSYVGLEVDLKGDKLPLTGGAASFGYTLGDNAVETRVMIFDSNNQLVRSTIYEGTQECLKGDHSFTWDGKDDNGVQLPDGVYRLSVIGLKNGEKTVETTLTPRGIVTGVLMEGDKTVLDVSGVEAPLENVTTVRIPGAAGASS